MIRCLRVRYNFGIHGKNARMKIYCKLNNASRQLRYHSLQWGQTSCALMPGAERSEAYIHVVL